MQGDNTKGFYFGNSNRSQTEFNICLGNDGKIKLKTKTKTYVIADTYDAKAWHHIKIVTNYADNTIGIYFDNAASLSCDMPEDFISLSDIAAIYADCRPNTGYMSFDNMLFKLVKECAEDKPMNIEISGPNIVCAPYIASKDEDAFFTASVTDAEGHTVTKDTIIWTLQNKEGGEYTGDDISIDKDGHLTVKSGVSPVELIIIAKSSLNSDVYAKKTVKITPYIFEITDVIANDKRKITECKVRKFYDFSDVPLFIVAAYSESGILQDVSLAELTNSKEWKTFDETDFSLSNPVSIPDDGYVKLFIFDNMFDICPLADAYITH